MCGRRAGGLWELTLLTHLYSSFFCLYIVVVNALCRFLVFGLFGLTYCQQKGPPPLCDMWPPPLPRRPDSAPDDPTFSVLFLDKFFGAFWIDSGSILGASGRSFCLPKSINKIIEFLEGFWKHLCLTFQRIFLNLGILFDTIFERL